MHELHVGASFDAYSMRIAPSRIARCEVRYDREKVLLIESGYNLDHQRAPFSVSRAVTEVVELPERVAG